MNYHQLKVFLKNRKDTTFPEREDAKGTPVILMNVNSAELQNLQNQTEALLLIVQHDPFSRKMILGIIDSKTNELLSSCSGRLAERFLDDLFHADCPTGGEIPA